MRLESNSLILCLIINTFTFRLRLVHEMKHFLSFIALAKGTNKMNYWQSMAFKSCNKSFWNTSTTLTKNTTSIIWRQRH